MSLDLSLNFPYFRIGMTGGSKSGSYAFDTFRLDAENLMLYRDEAEISLPPKIVKTLAVLIENAGSIVSKDELIERVWSDSVVEDSNLSQHLFHLRKTLGRRPDGGQYIETLRRRGYRFNGDVIWYNEPRMNGSAGVGEHTSTPAPGVERYGNVLRLVDRQSARERPQITVAKPVTNIRPGKDTTPLALAAGIAVLLLMASVAAFVWYRTAFNGAVPASRTELSLLRLTNGIKPLDANISPDGDYFVYHELADDGTRLWVQQVGSSSRVEIAPPTGRIYSGKTFSPDGRFVYLIAADDTNSEPILYRVATIGGPEVKILSGVSRPVSFSPDGREMVFIRADRQASASELVITDSDGGNQRTLLRSDSNGYVAGSPAWSPDGSMIALAMIDLNEKSGSGSFGLFGIDLSSGTIKKITEEKWDNIYRIVWTFDGRGLVMIATREAESYSTKRDQVYFLSYPAGESRRLTFDGSRHQEWSLGVTKDDAIIARPFNRSSQIWSMDPSGDERSAFQISHGFGDGRSGLAALPNGRIAFIARSGDEINIWLMNADGSDTQPLPSSLQVVEELRADARARFFVFSGFREGYSHLFRFDLDSKNTKQLTFGESHEVDSTISPDGNWIVYQSTALGTKTVLFKIPSDGGEPVPFGNDECSRPNYSPDGNFLSCIRVDKIVVLSANGAEIKSYQLPAYARVNFGAQWTPDGRGLIYILAEKLTSNLWVQPLDGKKPRPLTNFTAGDIHRYAYSTDSSRLFVARGYPIDDAILIRNFR